MPVSQVKKVNITYTSHGVINNYFSKLGLKVFKSIFQRRIKLSSFPRLHEVKEAYQANTHESTLLECYTDKVKELLHQNVIDNKNPSEKITIDIFDVDKKVVPKLQEFLTGLGYSVETWSKIRPDVGVSLNISGWAKK